MKQLFLILIASVAFLFCSAQKSSGDYKLIWADEFDKNGAPDPEKWGFQNGYVRNYEPQWYQPENASVADGYLVIEARKEKKVNPNYQAKSKNWKLNRSSAPYTSSSMTTKGKFDFQYGKVMMRAKIDIRQGMWPAFWLLGSNRDSMNWPASGEIDVMEYFRGNLYTNAVWEGRNGSAMSLTKLPVAKLGGDAWAKEFHVWEMEWDESSIVISVDNKVLNTIDLKKTVNKHKGNNPFHEKFYILLNLAMGQNWEKVPDSSLPAKFVVDYIRVYQK